MSTLIIKNCKLITQNTIIEDCNIVCQDGLIASITKDDVTGNYDAHGGYVSAGFVDIHTHGGYGSDFMDADKNAFDNVLKFHLDNGTTSVVATSVTAPISAIIGFLDCCRKYLCGEQKFARLLGAHLEGPYLSLKNKGAQKEEYLLNPLLNDYSFIYPYVDIIKTVTISPELCGADRMTTDLTSRGIVVCGGHDDGIYPEFMPAINNGLKHLTHIFCAMSCLEFRRGKRNVGLREYGLIDDRLTAEIIADNRHVPPELAKMILRAKDRDKVCVVSDSLRCAGMKPDGKLYKLGTSDDENAQLFRVSDGVAVLADGSRYAGSITPVYKMVRNLIDAGVPICDAFMTATVNPAKIVGEDNRIGSISEGKAADLCIFDMSLNLIDVFVGGKRTLRSSLVF